MHVGRGIDETIEDAAAIFEDRKWNLKRQLPPISPRSNSWKENIHNPRNNERRSNKPQQSRAGLRAMLLWDLRNTDLHNVNQGAGPS